MSPSNPRLRRDDKAVTPPLDTPASTAEVAAFLQNLRALTVSIGERISPILENEQGIDLRLFFILHNIAEGAVNPSAVARAACLPNSIISKHLDQLEKMGLIGRDLDSQDTRRIRLSLTVKGERVRRDAGRTFTTLARERLARIPDRRRGIFLNVLAELAHGPE